MGGRMVGISYPKDVWARDIKDASEDKVRRLRRAPREELVCEYAYGYNSSLRRNIFAVNEKESGGIESKVLLASTGEAGGDENGPNPGKTGSVPRRYVYAVASLGVVYDVEDNTQKLFTGHSKEVTAMAYNEALRICATAQRFPGRAPPTSSDDKKLEPLMRICVWTVDDQVERMRFQNATCSCDSLAFSCDGRWLFSVGGGQHSNKRPVGSQAPAKDASYRDAGSPRSLPSGRAESEERHRHSTQNAIYVWMINEDMIRRNYAQVSVVEAPRHILTRIIDASTGLTPHPTMPDKLFCCGPSCVTFLTAVWGVGHPGGEADSEMRRPAYATDSLAEQAYGFTAATYSPEAYKGLASTENGVIFIYEDAAGGHVCNRMCESLAGNAVHFLEWGCAGLLIAGGADCGISFLRMDASGELELLQRCPLRAPGGAPMVPQAAQVWEGPAGGLRLLVGTASGELALVDINDHCPQVALVQKTPWHEVRGAIAVHPSLGSIFAVGDASGAIWFYDSNTREILQAPPYVCQAPIRCMDWDPHGQLLACGLENGRFEILLTFVKDRTWNVESLQEEVEELPATLEALFLLTMQVLPVMSDGQPNCINDIRFSPARDGGRWLACGCRDGRVVIFSVLQSEGNSANVVNAHCVRHRILTGNSSAVLFLQFSNDGTQVCSNTKDGQLVTWDVESGEWRYPASTSWSEEAHPFRLTMAWETLGIWNSDKYDATSALVAASDWSARWMAVGDHTGLVKLHNFRLPITCAESRDYMGHCSRISGVAWTPTGKLLTVGTKQGDCVIQWRLHPNPSAPLGSPKELDYAPSPRSRAGDFTPQTRVIVQTLDDNKLTARSNSRVVDEGLQAVVPLCEAGIQASSSLGSPPATPPVTPVLPDLITGIGSTAFKVGTMPPGAMSSSPRWVQRQESSPSQRSSNPNPGVQRLISMESSPSPRSCAGGGSPRLYQQAHRMSSVESTTSWPAQGVRRQSSLESSPRSHSAATASTTALRLSSSEASLIPQGVTTWPATSVVKRSSSGAALRQSSPSNTKVVPPAVVSPQGQRVLVRQVSQVRTISPPRTQTSGRATSLPGTLSSLPGTAAPAAPAAPPPVPRLSTGGSVVKPPPSQPPPSNFSVRILEVRSGRTMSSAMVYLYHPPFSLAEAVEYAPDGEGPAVELFRPPRGWGVLRSSAGLLLWLSLSTGSLLEESSKEKSISVNADKSGSESEGLMRFDFEAAAGSTASCDAVSLGRVESRMPLLLDEGLLNPHDGRTLHVQLANNFDLVVKDWLSNTRQRASQIQSSAGPSLQGTASSVVVERPQRSDLPAAPKIDTKVFNVTSPTKHATIMRSFTS